jgi:hypothetical protein
MRDGVIASSPSGSRGSHRLIPHTKDHQVHGLILSKTTPTMVNYNCFLTRLFTAGADGFNEEKQVFQKPLEHLPQQK